MPSASVIVSTYTISRAKSVLECIKSLQSQTRLPDEIILVLDPKKELIYYYKSIVPNDIKIIVSDKSTLSDARNAGVLNSEGEIICFIDDDAIVEKDWLTNLLQNYTRSYVVGVGGLVKPLWESKQPFWFPEELLWIVGCSYKGLPEKRSFTRNPLGANMSFKKELFEKVGYFNPNLGRIKNNFMGDEETEFSMRLLKKFPYLKIVYDPEVIVYHRVPISRLNIRYIIKRSYYEGYGKAMLFKRYSSIKLNHEYNYLLTLITYSIPNIILHINNIRSISKILIILISIIATGIGFLKGMMYLRA